MFVPGGSAALFEYLCAAGFTAVLPLIARANCAPVNCAPGPSRGMPKGMTDTRYTAAAPLDSLPEGGVAKIEIDGISILLCRSKGQVFAVRNKCSHADEELACGRMRSGWIACPAHGARFRLETGEAMNPPATEPIQTFPVRVVEGMIEVKV